MTLLSPSDYAAVRAALDTSLDSDMLPDEIIGQDIYQGAAEREVLKRDPSAATRTGDDLKHIRAAAVFLTAARLAPAVPQVTSSTIAGVNYRRNEIDWYQRADDLRQMAGDELSEVLEPEEAAPGRPTMFTVASGRRGR